MCGRGRCTLRADDVSQACYRTHAPSRTIDMDRYRPSFNVPPGANLPVVRRDDGGCSDDNNYAVHCMRWGLIPSFTKKSDKPDFYKMFNARCESIKEKASFRRLLPKNRCLVAFEGFYEWKKDGSKKQPYYVHFKDGRPLVFAALYDSWKNSEDEVLYTFTIVTTNASPALLWLHDRMPVILPDKESTDAWLMDSKFELVLKPYEGSDLGWYPVTPDVGKPSFNGPECVHEIKLKTEVKNPISKFFTLKQIKEEDIKSEKNSVDESANTKHLDTVKEEQDTSDKKSIQSDEPTNTNRQDRVKEEPDISDEQGVPSLAEKDHDSKADESVGKGKIKRDYKEFSEDTKPHKEDLSKLSKSPAKKKKNIGTDGKQQPTLFSYFGKK